MPVNLYRSKTPIAVFSLPLLVAIICLPLILRDAEPQVYFFKWQTNFFAKIHEITFLNYSLAVIFISVTAHQLNNVFNRNVFYSKDTFLPGFIYVTGLASFHSLEFSPMILSHLIFVIGLAALLQIKRQEPAKNWVFLGSLMIGTSVIFSPPIITIALLPWITLMIVRPFAWREYVLVVLGLIIPTGYHFFFYFLNVGNIQIEEAEFKLIANELNWSVSQIICMLLLAVGALFAFLKSLLIMRVQVVQFKKLMQIIFFATAICYMGYLAGWYGYEQQHVSFLIPLSVLFSVWLLCTEKNILPTVLVIGWFLATLTNLFL